MGQYGTDEHKEEATAGDHVAVDMPFNDVQESDIVNDEGATEEHLPGTNNSLLLLLLLFSNLSTRRRRGEARRKTQPSRYHSFILQ